MDLDKFAGFVVVVWVISALLSLAVVGGLIYVALHFLLKVW